MQKFWSMVRNVNQTSPEYIVVQRPTSLSKFFKIFDWCLVTDLK